MMLLKELHLTCIVCGNMPHDIQSLEVYGVCDVFFCGVEYCVVSIGLRSNMVGTKFTVYDSGTNPGKTPGALLEESHTRQELAAICYVSGPPLFNKTLFLHC